MALWGTGSGEGEDKLPTWQENRNTGRKERPAINDKNQTYIAAAGYTQQVTKAGRTLTEVLVATGQNYTNTAGPGIGSANTTGVTWHDRAVTAASPGAVPELKIDVAFNHQVIQTVASGTPYVKVSNNTHADAFRATYQGTGNGTNILTFANSGMSTGLAGNLFGGNGEMMVAAGAIVGSTITKIDVPSTKDTATGPAANVTLLGISVNATVSGGGTG